MLAWVRACFNVGCKHGYLLAPHAHYAAHADVCAALEQLRHTCAIVPVAISQKKSPQNLWAVTGPLAGLSVIPSAGKRVNRPN